VNARSEAVLPNNQLCSTRLGPLMVELKFPQPDFGELTSAVGKHCGVFTRVFLHSLSRTSKDRIVWDADFSFTPQFVPGSLRSFCAKKERPAAHSAGYVASLYVRAGAMNRPAKIRPRDDRRGIHQNC